MEDNVDTIIAKYGQRTPKKNSHKGRAIIISLLVLLISAAIAVGALVLLKSKPSAAPAAPVSQTTTGPSPKDVIDKIATNNVVTTSKNYTLYRLSSNQALVSADTSSVVFKQDGYTFLTNSAAEDGLQFNLVNPKGASNKAAITDALKQTLVTAGFSEVAQDTSSLSVYKSVSYVNNGTVCQVTDFANANQTTLEQGVLCAGRTSLQNSYSNVKTLLSEADPAVPASAKSVTQTTVTSGTKQLLTLTVLPTNSKETTNYYFATLDKSFEYLGSRATPSVDNQASYTISDTLKKNISDPKWGTFLTDNIK